MHAAARGAARVGRAHVVIVAARRRAFRGVRSRIMTVGRPRAGLGAADEHGEGECERLHSINGIPLGVEQLP